MTLRQEEFFRSLGQVKNERVNNMPSCVDYDFEGVAKPCLEGEITEADFREQQAAAVPVTCVGAKCPWAWCCSLAFRDKALSPANVAASGNGTFEKASKPCFGSTANEQDFREQQAALVEVTCIGKQCQWAGICNLAVRAKDLPKRKLPVSGRMPAGLFTFAIK